MASEEQTHVDFWDPEAETPRIWPRAPSDIPIADSVRTPTVVPPRPVPEETQPYDFWPVEPPAAGAAPDIDRFPEPDNTYVDFWPPAPPAPTLVDGVPTSPATAAHLEAYDTAAEQVDRMQVPVLLSADRPDERLFVAAFDGTGNNKFQPELGPPTGVAQLFDQLQDRGTAGEADRIGGAYLAGPGTGEFGSGDGALGHTFEERAETMYRMFIEEAAVWLKENPGADIRVAAMGFSRGAEEAAYFTRLVDERGIEDPSGARYTVGADGLVSSVEFTKPPLVPPGEVLQAAVLLDPVAEGNPRDYDRRLPPSVVSALQITALHETRDQFIGSPHLHDGFSDDGRSLNISVPGAHSNIGDGYEINGLGIRNTNMVATYLNGLIDTDTPVFTTRPEPPLGDPANAIHDSERHMPKVYTRTEYDADGIRDENTQVGAPLHETVVVSPYGDTQQVPILSVDNNRREPIDETAAARLEYRPLAETHARVSDERSGEIREASSSVEFAFDRMAQAAMEGDAKQVYAIGREYFEQHLKNEWSQMTFAADRTVAPARETVAAVGSPMPPANEAAAAEEDLAQRAPKMR